MIILLQHICLHFGLLRGPILGQTNNCIYNKLDDEITSPHNIKYHCYGDDTKVYVALKPCDKLGDILLSFQDYITLTYDPVVQIMPCI